MHRLVSRSMSTVILGNSSPRRLLATLREVRRKGKCCDRRFFELVGRRGIRRIGLSGERLRILRRVTRKRSAGAVTQRLGVDGGAMRFRHRGLVDGLRTDGITGVIGGTVRVKLTFVGR